VLTYNAGDDLFPAQAHLLFRRSCQEVLEVHDLFTLGTYLTGRLVARNTSPAASLPQEAVLSRGVVNPGSATSGCRK